MKYSRRFFLFVHTTVVTLLLGAAVVPLLADGLPGQYLLSQRWRALLMASSPLNNPAYLSQEQMTTIQGVWSGGAQSASSLWEVDIMLPLLLRHSFALSALGENGGQVQDAVLNADGSYVQASSATNTNMHAVLSYAWTIVEPLSVGANATMAYQNNFGAPQSGFGLDVGASLWLLKHAVVGNHRAGIFMQNLIAPQPGADMQASYARQLKIALTSELLGQRLHNALEMNLSDLMANPELFVNAPRALEWNLAMATTYWLLPVCGLTFLSGINQSGFEHWGAALGLRIPFSKSQRNASLGYQLRDESQTILAPSHSVYARVELGESRLQRHEERMRKRISVRPNELYQQAMELFGQQKYWEAFMLFSRIEQEFPDFFKADWISFYRAKCLHLLDVHQLSAEIYTQTKLRYPKSDLVAHVNYGLMSVHYSQHNFAEVFRDYINLNMPGVPDSLRFHGSYLMGQALMKQGRYREALVPLSKLAPAHPAYVFARYSAAIVHFRLQQPDSALVALHEAVNAPVSSRSQEEMQSRSYLMTGLFFYEQNLMSKAMTALQKVPPTSLFYPEALLGQGWCAIKVQQWGDCFDIGRELQRVGREIGPRLEGMLFEGVSLLARKRHVEAAKVLTDAQLVDTTGADMSAQTLKTRRTDNTANRMDYEEDVRRINTVALQSTPSLTPVQIDSSITALRLQQTQLNEYLGFEAALQTRQGFWRTVAEIRPDIDYYLALANKQGTQKKSMAVQRELVKEQRDIDKEIESLERQMEQLEKP